jgi:hypothetical protein
MKVPARPDTASLAGSLGGRNATHHAERLPPISPAWKPVSPVSQRDRRNPKAPMGRRQPGLSIADIAQNGTHPICRLALVHRAFHRPRRSAPNPLAQSGLHPLPRHSAGCNDGLKTRSPARLVDRCA